MDRLRTMAAFVAVAEETGFAAAARRLNMSPPSMTRAIGQLEARLGARLLHRTTRMVTLTETGERYLADCRHILSEIEAADRHAAGLHASPKGTVRLTGSVVFGRVILTPILLDVQDRYLEISISTLFGDRVVHLVEEGMDVAIRIADLPDSSLSAIRVGQVSRVLCAAPSYLATRGRLQNLADLRNHDLIEFSHETPRGEWTFEIAGKPTSLKVSTRTRFNIADAAITAAVSGRGITRVLSYMVAPHVARGELEIVLPEFEPAPVPVHVVHKEAGQTSARVRAVVDFLVERLRQNPNLRWRPYRVPLMASS
ncbi:MAG: LysR family transcriptional regulator [Rhizobiaceae bacterium]